MLRGLVPCVAGVVLACALLPLPLVSAQDAPVAQHPAGIHRGSCAALGEVTVPLNAVVMPGGEPQGQDGAKPVAQSVTEIPMALPDLLTTGYAIAVHLSPEEVGTPIVCGAIGGTLTSDGTLAVGLDAMNGAKLSGVATFAPIPDRNATTVTLLVVDERAGKRVGAHDDAAESGPAGNTTPAVAGATDSTAPASDTPLAPVVVPAPAPVDASDLPRATAGLDGTTTISADGPGAKPARPDRNREKRNTERDGEATDTGNDGRTREEREHNGSETGA